MLSIGLLSTRTRSSGNPTLTAGPSLVRVRVRPPKLALLSTPFPPRNGLLLSTLMHASIAVLLMSLPILVRARTDVPSTADLRAQAIFEPLLLPPLPADAEGDPNISGETESEAPSSKAPAPSTKIDPPSVQLKRDYAGARTIVSNPPDATNGVQTIRRPDLVSPQKLTYPVRLPSFVIAPIAPDPPARAPVKRNLEHPIVPSPRKQTASQASEPRIPNPPLPISTLKTSLVFPVRPVSPPPAQTPAQPSLSAATSPVAPKFGSGSGSNGATPPLARAPLLGPRAAAVINAVIPPPDIAPVIPNAELASRFIVAPPPRPAPIETTVGAASGTPTGVPTDAAETSLRSPVESGTDNKVSVDAHGPGNVGSSSVPSGSAVPAAPAVTATVSGISISGGVPGRNGRPAPTHLNPRGSYALTIVSGGSSGGASRDLGVFQRTEIVYTVYIPMTGVGGGRDCPMQYALLGSGTDYNHSSDLLTPPAVVKKVPATLPKDKIGVDTGPVFLTGIIDDNGHLQLLHAVRAMDARALAALDALAQWLFLPAQLNGMPVSIKVLIGVNVTPADEADKSR
jgi:hypothetical protein